MIFYLNGYLLLVYIAMEKQIMLNMQYLEWMDGKEILFAVNATSTEDIFIYIIK
jgi:hypothetical protein